MTTLSFPAGERPTIRLLRCGDDVQVSGGETSVIEVQSSADEDELSSAVHASEGELRIESLDENLVLRVPLGAAIAVEDQGGNITITNVAAVQLVRAGGDVRLRMIAGGVDLDGTEGSFVVERAGRVTAVGAIEGDVRITSAASARLDRVEGDVRLNDVADVQLDNADGDVEINGAVERCTVDHVDGDLRVRDCGTLTIGNAGGDVTVVRARGLQIEDVGGDCSLMLDEGSASINDVGGDLSARLKTGALHVGTVQGDASVEGGYGDIKLPSIEGDLQLRLTVTEADYRARVEGDATVALPESADLRVEARARNGISGLHQVSGRKRVDSISTVVGSGRGSLEIDVENELSMRGAGASRLAASMRAGQPARPAVVIGSGPMQSSAPATGATTRLRTEDAAVAVEPAADERMTILRMLSEGKLDVEEAERLLNAVDTRAATSNMPMPMPPQRPPARVPREGDVFASLSADDLIELRSHGVDRQFILQLRQAGYSNLTVGELVELRQQGVDPGYIAKMREAGIDDLSADALVELRQQGVDPSYIAQARRFGFGSLGIAELVELRQHGVDARYLQQLSELNIRDLSYDQIIELRSHGVMPDYIAKMREYGFADMSVDDIVELRIHGVSADYIRKLREAGVQDLSSATISELRSHGVSAEYIAKMREYGYGQFSPEQLIELRSHGVTPENVRDLLGTGMASLGLQELIELRSNGVSADFVRQIRELGGGELTAEQIIELRSHGVDARYIRELNDATRQQSGDTAEPEAGE